MKSRPSSLPPEPKITVSLDSEYTEGKHAPDTIDSRGNIRRPAAGMNWVLSYQLSVLNHDTNAITTIIDYTKGPLQQHRANLTTLIGKALVQAQREGTITKYPNSINLATFFSRADLSTVRDYPKLKKNFMGVRRTYVTGDRRAILQVPTNRSQLKLSVRLIDVMLLSAAGSGLDDIGEGLGIPKVSMPDGYTKERMDIFLGERPVEFEEYAKTDAVITARAVPLFFDMCRDLGVRASSPTLGSVGVNMTERMMKNAGIDFGEFYCKERVEKTVGGKEHTTWEKRHEMTGVWNYCAQTYAGGLNSAYSLGASPKGRDVYDLDLISAYTSSMALIGVPDWSSIRHIDCSDPAEALKQLATLDAMSFARVKFKFPKSVRFPGLATRSENGRGLIYSSTGETMTTGFEIVAALNLGAEIIPTTGIVIDWLTTDVRPFEDFTREINRRRKAEKDEAKRLKDLYKETHNPELLRQANNHLLVEKMLKEIGNSAYGKIAQSVAGARTIDVEGSGGGATTFNTKTGKREKLSDSRITQPALASFITGAVRAVLVETVNAIPSNEWLGSITTDGFLSTCHPDKLDTSGPIAQRFIGARTRITPNEPHIWECKHHEASVYIMKTRGGISTSPDDWQPDQTLIEEKNRNKRVLARVSYKTDRHSGDTPEACAYWMDVVRTRTTDTKTMVKSFISLASQHTKEVDLTRRDIEVKLNFDWDFKRQLVNVRDVDGLITADTIPWDDIKDFNETRNAFEDWKKSQKRVLKTARDYDDFVTWKQNRIALRATGMRADNNFGPLTVALIKCLISGSFGTPAMRQIDIAETLTNLIGRTVPEQKVWDTKRRGSHADSLGGAIPYLTTEDAEMVDLIVRKRHDLIPVVRALVTPESDAEYHLEIALLEAQKHAAE